MPQLLKAGGVGLTSMILVTGAAGFIGMHVCQRLVARGDQVLGIDNLNAYYDVSLKEARLAKCSESRLFTFERMDIADPVRPLDAILRRHKVTRVVHLAAQPGVRYSLQNPGAYATSNIVGFLNILEACRHTDVAHLVYASSSSVYGGNAKVPFAEGDPVDHPISLYAATKKANELMAHTYSHLFSLPTTGLRFFTVYGPWGRPDMSPILFGRAIFEGRPIDLFNHGNMRRDFTFIDDIVDGVVHVLDKPATPSLDFDALRPMPHKSTARFRVFNIGNHNPIPLLEYVSEMERAIGRPAKKVMRPMQPGDVLQTYADTSELRDWVGFTPSTSLETGIARFVEWLRDYYGY